jgi:hypothetical protein
MDPYFPYWVFEFLSVLVKEYVENTGSEHEEKRCIIKERIA